MSKIYQAGGGQKIIEQDIPVLAQGVNVPSACETITSSEASDIYKKLIEGQGITNQFIEMKKSLIPNAGIGVFAKKDFQPSEAIEQCHCILLKWRSSYPIDPNLLRYAYAFGCDCDICRVYGRKLLLPLGYGSIYNTSLKEEDANAAWYLNIAESLQIFVCKKPIKIGEEIIVYYGDGYLNQYINQK
jgi:hypothetical protein